MKKIALLALMLVASLACAQTWYFEKPDYTQIQKNIKKKRSPLSYKTLMKRFIAADSTMSLKEKRHLYYGYTFDKDYSPYRPSSYDEALHRVLQKNPLTPEDYQHIVTITDKMLLETPFDVKALNYQLQCLRELGDEATFDKRFTQLEIIIDALVSSGSGHTKEEAFYVIYTAHEYYLLNVFGLKFGGMQSLVEHYDYLSLAENDADLEGLYFDVSPCFKAMSKMFK